MHSIPHQHVHICHFDVTHTQIHDKLTRARALNGEIIESIEGAVKRLDEILVDVKDFIEYQGECDDDDSDTTSLEEICQLLTDEAVELKDLPIAARTREALLQDAHKLLDG